MTKIITISVCVLFALIAPIIGNAEPFYYTEGEQIPLKIDSNRMVIKLDSTVSRPDDQGGLIASIGRISAVETDNHTIDGFIVCSLTSAAGYDTFLDSVQAIDGIYAAEPYYRNQFDEPFLVGTRFCVAFNNRVTLSQIDSIDATFKVVRGYEIEGLSNTYVLYNTDSSGRRLLDLANAYDELPQTRYAHPIFGVRPILHSYKLYDYYNGYQFHIKKVIGRFDTATVWDFGGLLTDSVVVADIDEGVVSHEDLPPSRVLPGFDFFAGDDDPSPDQWDAHGMGTAGIVAASHCVDSVLGLSSTTGVIGLNPACKIMPVRIFGFDQSKSMDTIAMAINYAWRNGADVLTNSWGPAMYIALDFQS